MSQEIKVSEALKNIAESLLFNPKKIPKSETAHAALLLAHAGWNRHIGYPISGYEAALRMFAREHPRLLQDFKVPVVELLVDLAENEKSRRYPDDRRIILLCGIPSEKVHVEWCYEKDYPQAVERVKALVKNPPPWLEEVS